MVVHGAVPCTLDPHAVEFALLIACAAQHVLAPLVSLPKDIFFAQRKHSWPQVPSSPLCSPSGACPVEWPRASILEEPRRFFFLGSCLLGAI